MPADHIEAVVLHVALNPITGVWSVMRDLALAQSASRRYAGVGIGVVSSTAWPQCYADELAEMELDVYRSKTLQLSGTAQFLWQRLQSPPVESWVEDLMKKSEASQAIIHFHNAWMSGVFLPVRKVAHGTVSVVATMHGMFANFDRKPCRHWLHRWMASRLTRYGARLTSVDRAGTPHAQRLLGIPTELFTVIHNGVAEDQTLHATKWGGQGIFQFGFLGNLEERKGWQIGAQAALELTTRGKRVRYTIAGGGPEVQQALEWQRKHPDIVEYLGHVSQPRRNFLPKLHALSLMSSSEGLPMSIIEALSIGLPVITTRVGGIPEALSDPANALLISRDSQSLVNAILSLYDRPNEHARVGAEGHRHFLRTFELGRIFHEYQNLYQRCLREPGSSSVCNTRAFKDEDSSLCDK
jgi:glycosyltransferase involved in cell wall biosynthesis